MNTALLALAQASGGQPPGCGQMGGANMLIMAAMFAVFYFLLIRPQQKRAREQDDRIEELESDLAEAKQDLLQAWDKIEGLDVDVVELDDKVDELGGNVKYWTEDGWDDLKLELEEAVTGAVLEAVTERIAEEGLRAHSVHFTWSNE